MTMADALLHPWLQSYMPVYDHRQLNFNTSIPTIDYSMVSSDGSLPVNQNFRNMQIQPSANQYASTSAIPGAFPGLKREDSKVATLQRRSHVLSQAVEEGKALVEPSWEMVAAATAQDNAASSSSSSNTNKGQNKRVHSELTPLSEEASMDGVADGSSPLSEPGSHKKGKSSDDEDRMTRGKGRASGPAEPAKARNPRTRKSNEADDDEAAQPRRSARHNPKVARRN